MKEQVVKHSGQLWSFKLRIPILNPKGWDSVDDFNHRLITKEEFCNRAANSELPVKSVSRREAAKALKKI